MPIMPLVKLALLAIALAVAVPSLKPQLIWPPVTVAVIV